MKKSIVLLLAVLLSLTSVSYAKSTNNDIKRTTAQTNMVQAKPQIMFNGEIFNLKYSTNKTPSGEYLNEYYKYSETPSDWTELITVSEFPNYPNQPSSYAESILSRDHSPNNYDRPMSTNSKSGKVTFVFLLTGKTDEYKYIEFNVMQVLPYKNNKGLKVVQYSKKYKYNTREEYLSQFQTMEENKNKYFGLVKEMEMPAVLHEEIE